MPEVTVSNRYPVIPPKQFSGQRNEARPLYRRGSFLSVLATWACLASAASGAIAQTFPTTLPPGGSWTDRAVEVVAMGAPEKSLVWKLEVPATLAEVWRAWTDPAGLAEWAAPAAAVDLRPGGKWEVHFFPDAPEGERGGDANEVVSFVPERELVLRAGAPPEFPTVRREKTTFRVSLTDLGNGRVRVVATQTGWKPGDEWDRAFVALAQANAEWLNWLARRFEEGPIDWSQMSFQ